MAGDKQKFNRASAWRRDLLKKEIMSIAPEVGATALIVSYNLSVFPDRFRLVQNDRLREMLDLQADLTEKALIANGTARKVIRGATQDSVQEVMSDTSYSSVIFLGHGTLPFMYIDGDDGNTRLDWYDLAQMVTHLGRMLWSNYSDL